MSKSSVVVVVCGLNKYEFHVACDVLHSYDLYVSKGVNGVSLDVDEFIHDLFVGDEVGFVDMWTSAIGETCLRFIKREIVDACAMYRDQVSNKLISEFCSITVCHYD